MNVQDDHVARFRVPEVVWAQLVPMAQAEGVSEATLCKRIVMNAFDAGRLPFASGARAGSLRVPLVMKIDLPNPSGGPADEGYAYWTIVSPPLAAALCSVAEITEGDSRDWAQVSFDLLWANLDEIGRELSAKWERETVEDVGVLGARDARALQKAVYSRAIQVVDDSLRCGGFSELAFEGRPAGTQYAAVVDGVVEKIRMRLERPSPVGAGGRELNAVIAAGLPPDTPTGTYRNIVAHVRRFLDRHGWRG